VLIWVADGSLGGVARSAIADEASAVFVSAATIWEVEIKRALGRLDAPGDLTRAVQDAGYDALPVNFEHAAEAGRLPAIHRDPFDRMLVAQARVEGLTLATSDSLLARYDVATLVVAPT
jgi:PIN domain nuclease of toxin-antitoxin system